MLALTKDIGMAYGLMAVFIIGIDQLFGTPRRENTALARHVGGRFLRTALLAVPVLAAFLSWSRYTAAMSPDSGAATVGSGQMGYGAVLAGGSGSCWAWGGRNALPRSCRLWSRHTSPAASV